MRIASSPVYLDSSALAKVYLAEPGSDVQEAALEGRTDLVVSDLAITEVSSALVRRVREGALPIEHARRIHREMLADLAEGEFRREEVTPEVFRMAERIILTGIPGTPLRAGDALHLALAAAARARVILTYDRRMAVAAAALASFEVVP